LSTDCGRRELGAVRADFLVVDAVRPNRSPEPNSLFIREIARYSLILEQLEDRRAAKNVTKRRLWNWSPRTGTGNLLLRFREICTANRDLQLPDSNSAPQLEKLRPARRFWRKVPRIGNPYTFEDVAKFLCQGAQPNQKLAQHFRRWARPMEDYPQVPMTPPMTRKEVVEALKVLDAAAHTILAAILNGQQMHFVMSAQFPAFDRLAMIRLLTD
jgi:hypothetical protein